jgi:DNA-binding response OmpR family regulator
MKQMHILWVDDEIDLLKPFILFLEERNYLVDTCNNGTDAIEKVVENKFDLVILDEMMPGLDGLATLQEIKRINPALPIVMVTKSEEEGLMDKAIASQISDYLIKPINPKQIIMAIKKIFQADEIRANQIGQQYTRYIAEIESENFLLLPIGMYGANLSGIKLLGIANRSGKRLRSASNSLFGKAKLQY